MKLKRVKNFVFKYWEEISIFGLAAFLRFWKLDWGQGFFFHPDEYHIAIAVSKISFPLHMDPQLYSYGSFIVYLNYFLKLIFNLKSTFLVGRAISAFFSLIGVYVSYQILNRLTKERVLVLLGTLLTAILPGFVQQAHFATPEATLGFFILATIYFLIRLFENKKLYFFYLAAACIGFASGVKTVGIILAPILIAFLVFFHLTNEKKDNKYFWQELFSSLVKGIVIFGLTYMISFPYSILNWDNFLRTFRYESGLGVGKQIVFYTRQFINTTPFVFQFLHVYPFTLGPLVFIFSLLGVVFGLGKILVLTKYVFSKLGWGKNNPTYHKSDVYVVIIELTFLAFFIANGILFLKWTRFMYPTFSYLVIFCIYALDRIRKYFIKKRINGPYKEIFILISVTSVFWAMSFLRIYSAGDPRVNATVWFNQNIPKSSYVLTEIGNTLEVPLTGSYYKTSFNFYDLDASIKLQKDLLIELKKADYFVVQSRRIYYNHQRLSRQFPVVNRFYESLFSGDLGFEKIKSFNSFPGINLLGKQIYLNDILAEETWSVFDHPVIEVYKKFDYKNIDEYEQILFR